MSEVNNSNQETPAHSNQETPVQSLLEKKVSGESAPSPDAIKEDPNFVPMPKGSFKNYTASIILCFCVAFGGFVFGFDTGTISGFVNMDNFRERFGQRHEDGTVYFSNTRTGLIVAIFNIGCAIGGVFLSKAADLYGRRIGIMISMVLYVVGIIVQISSDVGKWYQYFVGRLITGLAVGIISVVCPMFISESSPKAIRGTMVVCFQLCITLGIFLGYCTTYGTKTYTDTRQWRIPLGLCFAWAIILVGGMSFMPESPRYLVEKDKIEEAKRSVGRANKLDSEDPAVYCEVQLIQAGIEREKLAGKATWGELYSGKPKIFSRLLIGIMLQSLQQLTGDNYFFYYGTTIFKAVGMTDSFQTSIVLGVVNFASTFLGIYCIEKLGRRLCLLVGSVSMCVCFLIYSVLGSTHLYKDGYEGETYTSTGDAMIFITCLYIFFFASTWAGGCFAVVSEIYPLRIRSKAMGLAMAANWIWGFLISFFTPFITSAIHFYYGFVFFGCLLFSVFFVYFCVMETKGLSLEEVDELYASGVIPLKSSGWVPPPQSQQAYESGYAKEAKPEVEQHV